MRRLLTLRASSRRPSIYHAIPLPSLILQDFTNRMFSDFKLSSKYKVRLSNLLQLSSSARLIICLAALNSPGNRHRLSPPTVAQMQHCSAAPSAALMCPQVQNSKASKESTLRTLHLCLLLRLDLSFAHTLMIRFWRSLRHRRRRRRLLEERPS